MTNCSYCNARITPNQEKTSIALFMKPVCSKTECEKKARVIGDAAVDSLMTPQDQIRALLARRNFKEQSIKGFYVLESGSTNIAVDLNKISGKYPGTLIPQVGVLQINGDILEEGHGINRVNDIRQEIEGILKSKNKGAGTEKKGMSTPIEEKHEEEHKETETRKDAKIEEPETRSEKPEVIVPGNIIAILDKYGWKIKDNTAMKIIDSHEVKIDLSKLDQRGKSAEVDGYSYGHGQNNIIDAELKSLFGEIAKVQNIKEKNKMETKPDEIKIERIPPAKPENALAKILDIELNTETVLKYLCPDATLEEAALFLQVCKIKNLNPFIPGEVFLIKYDKTQSASIVVGKYAFTKKADQHPDFRGYQAGIIVLNIEGKIEEREGTFYLPKGRNAKEGDVFETLLGGWARVKRMNREDIISKVALQECIRYKKDGQPFRAWAEQPATQICKTAVVRALRDAFPGELGGLYDESEVIRSEG